jgi:tetratricopeptide (TPR) repeat protein
MSLTGSLLLLVTLGGPAQLAPEAVLAPRLDAQNDLIGRELTVEGRQPRFEYSRVRGWDEFRLEKSRVRFRLPRELVAASRPTYPAVRVRGTLKREGAVLVFDVAEMAALPPDLERLETAARTLAPGDVKGREGWVAWGEDRARLYDDKALAQRARTLAGEAVRAKAAMPSAESPEQQLKLAQEARRRGVAEPGPSSLAHRGFRGLLAKVDDPSQADTLAQRIAGFFPNAVNPPAAANVADWEAAYRADPAEGYRQADPEARPTLDRRLLADAIERALDLKLTANPGQALALTEEARSRLPDRPEVAARLQRLGLEAAEESVGSLRLADVQKLARAYREEVNQPEKATSLLRRWLDDQRKNRLSRSDAEGRLALADQYEQFVGDRAAAVSLLREAWTIDPESSAIADAFRRRGYRKVGDDWVASASARDPDAEAPGGARPAGGDPYLGLTKEEIRAQLGKPSQIARIATQGQLIEQWTYPRDKGPPLRINFVSRPDQPRATVIARESVP